MPTTIDADFNFFAKDGERSVVKYASALKRFNDGLEAAINLDNGIPIFLDTNVLLRTYNSSFEDRVKLKEFFLRNKERIIITNQVEIEFMKNREGVIDEFTTNITNKIPDNFQSDVVNKINGYYDANKAFLKDYPKIYKKIQKLQKDSTTVLDDIKKEINDSSEVKKNIKFSDDILDIYTQFKFTEKLSVAEITFLNQEYDAHKVGITSENLKSKLGKAGVAFPGIGDLKEKPDDPYGDFIIFHEMLRYVKDNNIDVVFLTYDSTKGDWLDLNGNPHVHYAVNTSLNTNKNIYILDAKRVLKGLLEISPTSLSEIAEDESNKYFIPSDPKLYQALFNEYSKRIPSNNRHFSSRVVRNWHDALSQNTPDYSAIAKLFDGMTAHERNTVMQTMKLMVEGKNDGDKDESH